MSEEVKNEEVLTEETPVENEEVKNEKKNKKFDVTKNKKYIALAQELDKTKEENLKLKDQVLRLHADFENFKKRSNEQAAKDRKYCLNDFLMDLIEPMDIFDKVCNAPVKDEMLKNYLIGFSMVNNQMVNVLENYGVKKIDCLNKPFDPTYASALESVEVEGVEPGIVTEVVQTGYMYKDKVLRPAMVKVSK